MKTNNLNSFLTAIKDVSEKIPYVDMDVQAKKIIAICIKNTGISKKEVLNYVEKLCNVPASLSDKEWKEIIEYHISWGDQFGKLLQNFKKITEDQFSTLAIACGLNPTELFCENKIDNFGWKKAYDILLDECKKTEKPVVCPVIPIVQDSNPEPPVVNDSEIVLPQGKTKRTIVMKDENGDVVKEFNTSKEASAATGICESSIRKNLNGYDKYQHLKGNDGQVYIFQYKENIVPESVKSPARNYSRNKIVIVNKDTKVVSIYDNAVKAAQAIGVKNDEIYYRAKNKNHQLNGFEIWYEKDYNESVAPAA